VNAFLTLKGMNKNVFSFPSLVIVGTWTEKVAMALQWILGRGLAYQNIKQCWASGLNKVG